MPELPEVETVRRHLAPGVEGRALESLTILDPRLCAPAGVASVQRAVGGRAIRALERRGKYLSWVLEGELHLVMHLRMTGNLLALEAEDPDPPFVRAVLTIAGAARIAFADPRRFGTLLVIEGDGERERYFAARLGVEPLGPAFTAAALSEQARDRRAPVKAFLLSQQRVAGVGNIYADEALFRAGIHPLRPAGGLRGGELDALRDAVVESLQAGIDARGATIDDFRTPDGARGSFQDRFLVHRRAGEPCPRCGTEIVKIVAAGRGTYVCERCQPPPRGRRVRRRAAPAARRRGRPRATP